MDLSDAAGKEASIRNELESYLLTIPREVRDEILHLVIFSDARYGNWYSAPPLPNKLQNKKRKAIKIPPTVYPEPDFWTRVRGIDVTFFQACRQLRDEGEFLLYSRITFDFVPNHWWAPVLSAKQFIMGLPPRQRRIIAHLRFDAWTQRHMPSCEWQCLMRVIAKECTNLQTLQIICPVNPISRLELTRLDGWIKGLSFVRPRSGIIWAEGEQFEHGNNLLSVDDPWAIKMDACVKLAREKDAQPPVPLPAATHFRFLDLPEKARRLVLRHVLIPQSGVLHPGLDMDVDDTTPDILPVLLTCKAIHREAESVLYSETIFSACAKQSQPGMRQFFANRTARQRILMRRCYCGTLGEESYQEIIEPLEGKLGFKLLRQKALHPCFPPPVLCTHEEATEVLATYYDNR